MNLKKSKLTSFMLAITVLISAWSAWGVNRAEAIIIVNSSGMFGVTRGETARSYVVNIGAEKGVIAIIKFLDSDGNVLAESGDLRLQLGTATFFELNADTLDFQGAQSVPIRVEITIGDPNIKKFRKTVAITSVEVSDNVTGKVNFVLVAPPEPD